MREELEHDNSKKLTFTRKRKRTKVVSASIVLVCLAFAIILGLVFYFRTNDEPGESRDVKNGNSGDQASVHGVLVNCFPESGANEESCKNRGCIWMHQKSANIPFCLYPESHGYLVNGEVSTTIAGLSAELHRINTNKVYSGEVYKKLVVTVEYQTVNRFRVKIVPENGTRYEVPQEALDMRVPSTSQNLTNKLYDVTLMRGPPLFGIVVKRKGTNTTIFSTDIPGFTYSEQFLQITTRLPSDNLYGFGEHNHRRFRHDMNWKTWSIFTRDIGPIGGENLYGAHPVYMNLEDDGQASVVLLKNSNAMDIVLQPSPNPAVTYRVIGGILDFYIFMGPSPEEAVQQYIQAIGLPVMPPYWSLGYHLCRWGYKDLEDMSIVVNRTRAAGIPYDVQWGDIEYMYKKLAFTVDKKDWSKLTQLVQDLHDHNQKFVVIVDPGIGADRKIIVEAKKNSPDYNMFDDGIANDIFVKNASDEVLIATVWPGLTAYPDFTNPKTEKYWLKWMKYFYENESIEYDSLWIDMNEPSSFVPGSIYGCENTTLDYPPYVPKSRLKYGLYRKIIQRENRFINPRLRYVIWNITYRINAREWTVGHSKSTLCAQKRKDIAGAHPVGKMFDKTLCMTSKQHWGLHYDVHSLYAHSMAIQTYNALETQKPGQRPWTMTRSSFVGTGRYATKWMGDNQSRWPNLHWSIVGIIEFSMFGFAMNGADICGFWYEADYEMCLRWHQLGAFYPFARNHNGKGDDPVIFRHQDPASWDQRFVDIVKPVLLTRYKLLPYLYTLMYKAHEEGYMVMKALLFEFPEDKNTWTIDKQFLLGPALLLSPVLEQNQTYVEAYFPEGRWYEYTTGEEIKGTQQNHSLYTPIDKFNLHVRGGHVIPWQEPSITTFQSRKNSMGIIVALDKNYLASGELFLDDGVSLETHKKSKTTVIRFSMEMAGVLTIRPQSLNYRVDDLYIKTIEIYGLDKIPSIVNLNGERLSDEYVRQSGKIIQIINQGRSLSLNQSTTITWLLF